VRTGGDGGGDVGGPPLDLGLVLEWDTEHFADHLRRQDAGQLGHEVEGAELRAPVEVAVDQFGDAGPQPLHDAGREGPGEDAADPGCSGGLAKMSMSPTAWSQALRSKRSSDFAMTSATAMWNDGERSSSTQSS